MLTHAEVADALVEGWLTGGPSGSMKGDLEGLLRRARIARLATVGADGGARIVPACFVYHDGRLYSVVDEKPKRAAPESLARLRHIRSQPRVCLLVDHYEEDWSRLWWVMVLGKAEVLVEGEEYGAALGALREKYPQYRRMALEGRPVIRITVERVRVWSASGPSPSPSPKGRGKAGRADGPSLR